MDGEVFARAHMPKDWSHNSLNVLRVQFLFTETIAFIVITVTHIDKALTAARKHYFQSQ